jgi:hypothetical protein
MTIPTDNETWIIEAGGDVVSKQAQCGNSALTDLERLVYCLWVADYGMRNAGDLDTAAELYTQFQTEARALACSLGYTFTCETFFLPVNKLAEVYLDRFEDICNEIKNS